LAPARFAALGATAFCVALTTSSKVGDGLLATATDLGAFLAAAAGLRVGALGLVAMLKSTCVLMQTYSKSHLQSDAEITRSNF
jgi:hypothetical protein